MPQHDTPASPTVSQPPVGIDLGTTFSVLAYIDSSGRPVTVPNAMGDLITPSAVFFDDSDVIVGREARKSSVINPDTFAECFKRDMGSANHKRKIRGHNVPPEVLSAFVLERMKLDAEQKIGPIRQAVITVPAFFDETRRHATQLAGRLAGIDVMDIINEPTAAAVAYGYQQGFLNLRTGGAEKPLRVVVYDLGGGTFDVTVLEISGTLFRALATDGDVQLGGRDFDERLVAYLAEQFLNAHGVDPRSDPQDAAQLWLDAIDAKHSLSERSKTNVVCFHAGIRLRVEVTRQLFDELTRELLERSETTASLVVAQAGLTWDQIDRVLLVGGASRMPMVSEMLRRTTGKDPDRSVSPDEVVAHGAALYAEMLAGQAGANGRKCELVNVNSHSLGVVSMDRTTRARVNAVLIPKNTALPAKATRKFSTARANQENVLVPVVEGESHDPADCISLGKCIVQNLPPNLPAGTPIEVEYRYGGNGCVSVSARVPSVRLSAHVELKRTLSRNLEDLEVWKKRLCGYEDPQSAIISFNATTVDPTQRASVVKRLDALCLKIGSSALPAKSPEGIAQARQAAVTAAGELHKTKQVHESAEQARRAAVGTSEIIRLDAVLTQARAALHQTQVRNDFANIIFGRECVRVGFCPAGLERDFDEVRKWQNHLQQMSGQNT